MSNLMNNGRHGGVIHRHSDIPSSSFESKFENFTRLRSVLVAATAGGRRNRCKTLMEDEFDDVAFTELFVGDGVARNGDLLGAVAGELNFKTTRIIDSHDREALAVITEVFYTPQTSDDRNAVGLEPV